MTMLNIQLSEELQALLVRIAADRAFLEPSPPAVRRAFASVVQQIQKDEPKPIERIRKYTDENGNVSLRRFSVLARGVVRLSPLDFLCIRGAVHMYAIQGKMSRAEKRQLRPELQKWEIIYENVFEEGRAEAVAEEKERSGMLDLFKKKNDLNGW